MTGPRASADFRLHPWRAVNTEGVGTERGGHPPQPLGITYIATPILTLFIYTTSYSVNFSENP